MSLVSKTDEERDTRGHGMTMCKNTMPLVANPTHDWPGLSKDNRSSRVATNSQLSSETVKDLKTQVGCRLSAGSFLRWWWTTRFSCW